jgi:hypothetical protein
MTSAAGGDWAALRLLDAATRMEIEPAGIDHMH